jgi:hypothetical protein
MSAGVATDVASPDALRPEWRQGGYLVSTDAARLDLEVVHAFLRESYWARGVPRVYARFGFEPLAQPEWAMSIVFEAGGAAVHPQAPARCAGVNPLRSPLGLSRGE